MRASIIIAAHQEGDLLLKTVETCVRDCSQIEHEIVIADDASADGSVDDVTARFPHVRVARHETRRGVSPTKDLGARRSMGNVLVFLDGHTNPEPGAIARLVEDVEALDGDSIVTPAVPALDVLKWRNLPSQTGHGYSLDVKTFECGWLPLEKMVDIRRSGRTFYESPALIGCVLAVSRQLYDELWGFDAAMQLWGVEDLDFGLKSWLLGHPILHDPTAVVGHRFQESFERYNVSAERVLVSQLRMARKNFSPTVWAEWVRLCAHRSNHSLAGHPEGFFARAWHLFEQGRASAEHERIYLHGARINDEFWFAQRHGLPWPRLDTAARAPVVFTSSPDALADPQPSPAPSPSPSPACKGTLTISVNGIGQLQFTEGVSIDGTYDTPIIYPYTWNADVTITGAEVTQTFTTADTFFQQISNSTFTLEWYICAEMVTVSHPLYVTAGTPADGVVTITRMNRVTKACDTLVQEPDIVDALWEKVAGPGTYELGAPYPTPVWKILDGTPGECIAIADLFVATIEMLGVTPGDGKVVYCYVDPNGGSHENTSPSAFATRGCAIGQNGHDAAHGPTHANQNAMEKLVWIDGNGGKNNWEACYKYRNTPNDAYKYYAAGTGGDPPWDTVQDVMDAYARSTLWQYVTAGWATLGDCVDPGPDPERDPY